MVKKIIHLILILVFITIVSKSQNRELLYVGTFSGNIDKGIYVYEFDRDNGTLSLIQILGGMLNPTFIEIHPNGGCLYSVNRNPVGEDQSWGSVSSFSIDQGTGKLTHGNDQPSYGNGPCHIILDSKARLVFIANYYSGSIAAYPILKDGSLAPASSVIQHTGSSILGERQSGPHAHCTVLGLKDKYLYAADLGIDRIKTYRVDYKKKQLKPVPASDGIAEPGAGPRHIVLSSDQKFAYLLEEIAANVSVFSIDPLNGSLKSIQRISTLPEDFKDMNFCADIHIDPTGKFLYASNRGHNSLAIYEIDDNTGMLKLVDIQSVAGDWPRNFLIDPKGDYLFVANRRSNNIVVFKRDLMTGILKHTGVEVNLPEPVCIKMLELK